MVDKVQERLEIMIWWRRNHAADGLSDREEDLLRLGFALGCPGGDDLIAPAWVREYRKWLTS